LLNRVNATSEHPRLDPRPYHYGVLLRGGAVLYCKLPVAHFLVGSLASVDTNISSVGNLFYPRFGYRNGKLTH